MVSFKNCFFHYHNAVFDLKWGHLRSNQCMDTSLGCRNRRFVNGRKGIKSKQIKLNKDKFFGVMIGKGFDINFWVHITETSTHRKNSKRVSTCAVAGVADTNTEKFYKIVPMCVYFTKNSIRIELFLFDNNLILHPGPIFDAVLLQTQFRTF